MNAGRMRHRVELRTPLYPNESGYANTTYSSLGTFWAEVEPLRGREYWQSQHENSEVTHRIRMRFVRRAKANANLVAFYGGREFEVLSVIDPNERNISLELMCKERVS